MKRLLDMPDDERIWRGTRIFFPSHKFENQIEVLMVMDTTHTSSRSGLIYCDGPDSGYVLTGFEFDKSFAPYEMTAGWLKNNWTNYINDYAKLEDVYIEVEHDQINEKDFFKQVRGE